MPRIPISKRRRCRLIQILRLNRLQNMANLTPPNPQTTNTPTIFIQLPMLENHQQLYWVELGLMVHVISFNIMFNGRETVIVLHNSHYLAQLISEGIRLSMNNYMNHIWLNNILHLVAPNLTLNATQTMMGEWNLPPYFVPIQNARPVMDLPFFTPEIATNINPIFTP